ncbi:MAG: cytochrome o ubiquinol oxidase subunit IV [Sphingomonadales bacterium]|nr:cytochrome o ubiquinol oxidase subunit IV [Sphingomonadales bacterium]
MSDPETFAAGPASELDGREDHAPGDAPSEDAGYWVHNANFGLALSVLLTAGAFAVVRSDLVWGPAIPVALLVLAIAQMGVQLVFFLHITTGPDNTNNVLALAFGLLVTFLIVVGSIWIMDHLNHNMMPMQQLMQMQP